MKDNWHWERIRQVHLDFHIPEFPREALTAWDAKALVSELVRAKVNVVAMFAKCHFGNAYYDTKVGHKHSALTGDYLKEVIEEAHAHDIKVIAYYSLGTDEWIVKRNPDWYQVDENGHIRDGNGTVWHRPCMNSPYREELVLPQIREIVGSYDADGLFLDIPYIQHHRCFCRYCKRKFKELYGRELEPSLLEKEAAAVTEFARTSAIRCLQEIRRLAKSLKPDIKIAVNCAWKMGEPEEVNETADIGVWESQPAAGSYLYNSFKARWSRHQRAPSQIMTVRFTEGWGLLTCKTAEQLKYEAACIMANGGIVNIGDQAMQDGSLQKGAYDVLAEVFSFVEERERFAVGAESVKHIALICSYTANRYWDKGDFASLGAAKILTEGHRQFDIFYNDSFPDLSGYRVVVLPETVRLSAASVERLESFVRSGGLLLAAGRAAFQGGGAAFGLGPMLGLEFVEFSPYRCAYLAEQAELWRGLPSIPQLLDGPILKTVSAGAQTLSGLLWPSGESVPPRAFRHDLPPPGPASGHPGISSHAFGDGRALYVAAEIFSQYWNTGHHWLKRIVNNLLDLYDRAPPFTLSAPATVEAVLTRKDGKRFLHLINFQATHTGNRETSLYDPIEAITPVRDLRVSVRAEGLKRVVLRPSGAELPFTTTGDYAEFTVPSVHVYEIGELE